MISTSTETTVLEFMPQDCPTRPVDWGELVQLRTRQRTIQTPLPAQRPHAGCLDPLRHDGGRFGWFVCKEIVDARTVHVDSEIKSIEQRA